MQCRYAAEWAAVEWFHRKAQSPLRLTYVPPSEFEFQQYEANQSPLHCAPEQLNELDVVQSTLYTNAGPFTRPALIVEANCVLGFARGGELSSPAMCVQRPDAVQAIAEWRFKHPTGRVILLVDEARFYPSTLEMYSDDIHMQTHMYA